jgi:hypothetical protein
MMLRSGILPGRPCHRVYPRRTAVVTLLLNSYDLTSFKGDMIIEEEFAPVAQLDRAADF